MNLSMCTVYFDAGKFSEATIVPAVGQKGWYLEIKYKNSLNRFNVTRQRGGDCVYKSLDAAWSASACIGFREVTVKHSGSMLDYL